jgi:hypothetical protein
LAFLEEEKIKEKRKEILLMQKRLKLLTKKHALIEKKTQKMEGFGEFTKRVSRDYSD